MAELEPWDEYEAMAMGMLADLIKANAVPESLKLLNEEARRDLIRQGFPEPIIAKLIFGDES